MTSPLLDLEPSLLWKYFDDIRQVPRPSKHEEKIAAHMVSWAEEKDFEVRRDAVGNLVVVVPATPGHEDAPTVVIQGHLDMVCEKNEGVEHDFMKDPIPVVVDGDWVKTEGTTLGADNGVGVAAGMAIVDDPEAVHGPLELLMTMDEETGLTGAQELDSSIINGELMINLDSEEDATAYIGCAGGADSTAEFPLARRSGYLDTVPLRVVVKGLRGGHSGLNIHENRGNAIKLLVRVLLSAIDEELSVDLVSINGGSKHNAIPREAFAVIRVRQDQQDELNAVSQRHLDGFREEFGTSDPDLEVFVEQLEDGPEHQKPVNVHNRDRLLRALNGVSHGVSAMSRDVPGLVETSSNLAVITTEEDVARLTSSHRSSVMPALLAEQQEARSVCELGGGTVSVHDAYPGWKPNPESPLIQRTSAVYERLFGKPLELKAIHAGLECGLLLEKKPEMDIVSFGPEIVNAHSPEEAVQISSVQKTYALLRALLEDLTTR